MQTLVCHYCEGENMASLFKATLSFHATFKQECGYAAVHASEGHRVMCFYDIDYITLHTVNSF